MENKDNNLTSFSVSEINFGPEVYASSNRAVVKKDFLLGLPIEWREQEFDYKKYIIEKEDGFFLEVAGPTEDWDGLVSPQEIKNYSVSNVFLSPEVDLVVDARDLPFQNSCIDGIFVSCLGSETDPDLITSERDDITLLLFKEAARALKPGGILVYHSAFRYTVKQALDAGLELVQFKRYPNFVTEFDVFVCESWDCIFQKREALLLNQKTSLVQ